MRWDDEAEAFYLKYGFRKAKAGAHLLRPTKTIVASLEAAI